MKDVEPDVATVARIDAVPIILEVVCRTTGMGFAAVASVTEERWVACALRDEISVGMSPGDELEIETTFCRDVRATGDAIAFDNAADHPVYCRHPSPIRYGFQSYISMPIRRPDGTFFGTLCALDPRPAPASDPATVAMFRLLADLIGFHLDAQERLRSTTAALLDERRTAELRDLFVAVLGHDLRNPLAALAAGVEILRKDPQGPRTAVTLDLMRASARRMGELIDDVLDLARGQLGDGLEVRPGERAPLAPVLEQVLAETRAVWPSREIQAEIALDGALRHDRGRIAQLVTNLLANALQHGRPDTPVRLEARLRDGRAEIAVVNSGEAITPEIAQRLFRPFVRSLQRSGPQGLGLGLYIAHEIAKGHGGTLEVESTPAETRFTFRMPAD